MSDDQNAVQLAEAALGEDYNPFARAKDREYPHDEVTIYWNEVAARKLRDADLATSKQANRVAIFQADLEKVPELRKAANGNKATLSAIQKAVKADTAKLIEEQAEYDRLEAEALALKEELKASAVTLGLRGYSREVTDAIHEKVNALHPSNGDQPNPEWAKRYNAEIIAAAIEWTQKADEAERNTTPISAETVLQWRRDLPEESYLKLTERTSQVTLAVGLFESLENAGFLARS